MPLFIWNQRIFHKFEAFKHRQNQSMRVHPVRIEFDARLPTNRHNKQQLPARCHHPLEFFYGIDVTKRIEWIAIAAQANVLNDMHA